MASIDPFEAAILFISTLAFFIIPPFIIFPPVPVEKADALRQTHTKLGVGPAGSRTDEAKTRARAADGNKPTVLSLWVYPVKSCQGIELSRARVRLDGVEYDRMYTLAQLKEPTTTTTTTTTTSKIAAGASSSIDKKKPEKQPRQQEQEEEQEEEEGEGEKEQNAWDIITMRQFALMATIKIDLWVPDPTKHSRQLGKLTDPYLVMRFPWRDRGLAGFFQTVAAKLSRGLSAVPEKEVLLPVDFPADDEIKAAGWATERVRIWSDTVPALNLEKELPAELRRYLGVKNRLGLFRINPARRRDVFGTAPRKEEAGYQPAVSFQDGFPINLMNIHSVQDVNEKMPADAREMLDLDVRRFRANIIISGPPPYDEETWKRINLRDSAGNPTQGSFYVVAHATRCRLPNVHPTTGVKHGVQPDKTLRTYRNVDEGAPKMGCLGMQLCAKFDDTSDEDSMQFVIEAGMKIDVTETGKHVHMK